MWGPWRRALSSASSGVPQGPRKGMASVGRGGLGSQPPWEFCTARNLAQSTLLPSGGPEQARGCQGWWGSQKEGRHAATSLHCNRGRPATAAQKDADRIREPTFQRSGNPTDGPDLILSLGQERPRKPQLHRESVSASSVEWDWKAKLSLGKGQFAFLAPLRVGLQAAPALPFPWGLA